MRKIAVFTGTRAEYGLLYWLIKAIHKDSELELQLIVSGTHLSPHYGETWREIEADGFKIDAKVEMLLSSDSPVGVVKSMGIATIGFADVLERLNPDILVVLGDRYEALAIAQAALIMKIPIAHAHGGELTFGAYDDAIRHAITKMASIHFVATEAYRRRILQLGEDASNVFNVGALGLEHVLKTERYSMALLVENLQLPLKQPYFLVTYHSATIGDESIEDTFKALFHMFAELSNYQILFTYPNADNGNHRIIQLLEQYCQEHSEQAYVVRSLGYKRYLSAISHAEVVIGNSSSGIIEAPSLGVPTVNIGLRQEGRLAADSVIHAEANYLSIDAAIKRAMTPAFKAICQNSTNPYGDGEVSARILPILKTHHLPIIKKFHNLDLQNATC